MTTLILIQRKFLILPLREITGPVRLLFERVNRKGLVTTLLITGIAGFIALYVVSLYGAVTVGFDREEAAGKIQDLQEEVLGLDTRIQQESTLFMESHKEVLEGMQPISAIRYVREENVAVLPLPRRP